MILEIYMKNCALVEELRLTIDKNLNILTGETGSGKSIIIDALGLCLGNKYDKSFLRKGTDKGFVETVFYSENENLKRIMSENDIDMEDGIITIARVIYSDGKSTARVNGRTVKLSLLKEIVSYLIDVHGQHQNQLLFDPSRHLKFIDAFAGETIVDAKMEYKELYSEYSKVKSELLRLNDNKDEMEIQREIDLLKFQIDEIEAANLNPEEYEELIQKRDVFRNSEKIFNNLNVSYEAIHNSEINAIDIVGRVVSELSSIASFDKKIGDIYNEVERIMYELQDLSGEIRDYKDSINFEPYELEQIEIRLNDINNLRRKYGDTIEDIFNFHEKISKRLYDILNRDEEKERLKEKLESIEKELYKKSEVLTEIRKEQAEKMAALLIEELDSMDMKNVRFCTEFSDRYFTAEGRDFAEFMISFNVGEDLRPISKVASGGEISRFMLAFKTILADTDEIETLVFDEIDTGISGIAAQNVGEKLSDIATKKQIICITHLPQIAANADTHYCIEKKTDGERTFTVVEKLDADGRKREISRLISGKQITEKTIEHAKEILSLAEEYKCR
ncbi:DNA repair protein RecN [Peptacetobacter sp.]|uniref:DNA repair protein RecN n=1 Tax=Peptacetobacter sp. TaxID=2991975 RepID=UPI00261A40FD|nr:DNA repair protein RecN [Peptacetobacter sp.]MEE0452623.1 DNA repair protein RecN [Peptacetobacter sp.]